MEGKCLLDRITVSDFNIPFKGAFLPYTNLVFLDLSTGCKLCLSLASALEFAQLDFVSI